MYLLYIDGSGSIKNPRERYFILGGVSVFERQIFHLIREFDQFVNSLGLGAPEDIELHASVIAAGRQKPWKGVHARDALNHRSRIGSPSSKSSKQQFVRHCGDKAHRAPHDPVEYAFEEICNRFNLRLTRLFNRAGRRLDEAQRGPSGGVK